MEKLVAVDAGHVKIHKSIIVIVAGGARSGFSAGNRGRKI